MTQPHKVVRLPRDDMCTAPGTQTMLITHLPVRTFLLLPRFRFCLTKEQKLCQLNNYLVILSYLGLLSYLPSIYYVPQSCKSPSRLAFSQVTTESRAELPERTVTLAPRRGDTFERFSPFGSFWSGSQHPLRPQDTREILKN